MPTPGDQYRTGRPGFSLLPAIACSCFLHLLVVALPTQSGSAPPSRILEARLEVAQSEGSIREIASPAKETPDQLPSVAPASPSLPTVPLETRYYLASEVSEKAEPVEIPPLIYPEEAYLRRIEGTVVLRVFINASGGIDSVDILSAQPPDTFERSALDAVLATQFQPARLFGRPVSSQKTLEIRFDPFADRQ